MKRNLSLVVALASAVAFSPAVEAKPDKDKGGKGGGGGGEHRTAPSVQSRPQMRSGGNMARVQPQQIQRYNRPQVQRTSPSVALTGRTTAQQRAIQEQRLTNQQRLTDQQRDARGANWNERRKKLINQYYRHEQWKDRHDGDHDHDWDHHDRDWDHHDHDDHYYYVPFSVHRYWDHNRVYYWNNNPYRWYNNAWVVVSPGLGYGYGDYYGSGDYYGDGGSVTARVQRELAREGYDPGPVDGVLGGRTRDAIIDFQRDNDLPVTGRIDTPLLRELGL